MTTATATVTLELDHHHTAGASRRRLLFAVLLTTALISFGLALRSYLKPIGHGSELPR